MKNVFKKIYYNKYAKTSYSISGVDLIINRMFSKIKKGIYIDEEKSSMFSFRYRSKQLEELIFNLINKR